MFKTPYEQMIYTRSYARWDEEHKRRETWGKTVERYGRFMTGRVPEGSRVEFTKALDAILLGEVMPSMRLLWTAGKAAEIDNICAYNCAYLVIDNPKAFAELMYILMCGTGVGYSVERQYINKLPSVPSAIIQSGEPVVFRDSKQGWADGYLQYMRSLYAGVELPYDLSKIRKKGALLKTFGGRACLTADTILYKDRKKHKTQNEITIKELYDLERSQGRWKSKPNHFKDVKIRSLDESTGKFYRNSIITVVSNGSGSVYEVTTKSGYRIKATSNHRFMKDTGEYQELNRFSAGDMIAVNGSKERKTGVCVDCGAMISRRAIRCVPCSNKNQLKEFPNGTSARQRRECRSYKKDYCEACGRTNTRFEIHHSDLDVCNNTHSNLINLCSKCHQEWHTKDRTFSNPYSHKYISYDEITSIRYVGEEEVFDLQMEAPNHNFVANGFISHNSGPEPLDKLLKFTAQVFKQALGRGLSSIECYDICCYIAEVIVAGGTRRSACISLSNLSDDRMAKAKSGDFISMNPQRRMSNNSVAYTEKPDSRKLISEFIKLIESQSGERGIFNREAANFTVARTDRREIGHDWGCNPCGEILLRPFEFCNLTECIIRPDDTLESLKSKVEKATILGCVQSTLTTFKFIRRIWTKNCEEERLLGVSLTGLRDHPLLKKKSAEAIRWLKEMKEVSIVTAKKWSRILDIPMPKAITCVKPSGTVSQLVDCSSGLHPRHAPYYIRRVRVASTDPVAKLLRDSGVPNQPETGDDQHNPNTVVFEFPHRSPEGSVLTDEVGALEQLKYWKMLKQHWCEHNPSCTIYVKESEWTQVLAWVDANWYQISGITFLPHNTGVYQLAPYEEIDEETYDRLVSAMPPVDFNQLNEFEQSNETTGSQEYACSGGGCEI